VVDDKDRVFAPRYKLREDHRQTVKGVEKIIPAGTVVEPIQEQIHYQKRNHRVQVKYTNEVGVETIAWLPRKKLSVLR
jgi:hypothetical protein